MANLNLYQQLTYIETYDGDVKTITASIDTVSALLKDEQFLNLGNELINKSNIKRVFTKELSDVDKVVYSIEDKNLRSQVQADIDKRLKDGLRVNVWIVQNLLTKHEQPCQ